MTQSLLLNIYIIISAIMWVALLGFIIWQIPGFSRNRAIRKLMGQAIGKARQNHKLPILQQAMIALQLALEKNPENFSKTIAISKNAIQNSDDETMQLNISVDNPKSVSTVHSNQEIPVKWIEGVLANQLQQEQDNFGLAMGINKALQSNPTLFDGEISSYLPKATNEAINSRLVAAMLESPELSKKFSPLEIAEKRVIEYFLNKMQHNKSHTVRVLDITINTLKAKMKKYNIPAA